MTSNLALQTDVLNADYLHSAFVIDHLGNEIKITRDMIIESCQKITSQVLNYSTPLQQLKP